MKYVAVALVTSLIGGALLLGAYAWRRHREGQLAECSIIGRTFDDEAVYACPSDASARELR